MPSSSIFATNLSLKDYLVQLDNYSATASVSQIKKTISNILGIDKNNVKALNHLAIIYIRDKKYGIARILLDRALRQSPKNHILLNNLAVIDLYMGEEGTALSGFISAKRSKKSDKVTSSNLGSFYLKYGDYKKALVLLESAYEGSRTELKKGVLRAVQTANNYAVALVQSGKPRDAAKVYKEIVEADTSNELIMLDYLALSVDVLKDRKEGLRVASKLKFLSEDRKILRELEKIEGRLDRLE